MTEAEKQIIELLTEIRNVTAMQAASSLTSVTAAARQLKLAGLDNETIAGVLNTTTATVRTLTSNLRGGKRRK